MSQAPCRLAIAAVALAVVGGATGCGADGDDVSAGDPGYAYQAIASLRANLDLNVLEPHRLVDALPNREISIKTHRGEATGRFSDLVAAGRVTMVTPHEGIYYPNAAPTAPGDEEAGAKVVAFDDPDADERVALVTLQVDWSAGAKVGQTLQFRIGVPPGADPGKFLAGVRGIGEAVVLLDRIDDGRYKGDYYPILGYAGLGTVADDGTISFDGLGDEERDFSGGVDTLDELETEASRPDTTLSY